MPKYSLKDTYHANPNILGYLINVTDPVFLPSISTDGSTFVLSVSGLLRFENYLTVNSVLMQQEQKSGSPFNYSMTVNPSE